MEDSRLVQEQVECGLVGARRCPTDFVEDLRAVLCHAAAERRASKIQCRSSGR
jgi:hypothetical protein